uniref:V-SNARE coiled-coil homology domain-containing protein n=1 Tax=Timema shepardi TaxID=629360 RepID=A0A7R9FYQ8_TIMSH|nr:unnamed protein product [Timema shepardi]
MSVSFPSGNEDGLGGPQTSQQQQSQKRLQQTQAKVDEVVGIMRVNVEKVLERDTKLSELDNRADALHQGASRFEQQAGKLKKKYCVPVGVLCGQSSECHASLFNKNTIEVGSSSSPALGAHKRQEKKRKCEEAAKSSVNLSSWSQTQLTRNDDETGLKKIPDQDEERADVDDSESNLEERKIHTNNDFHDMEYIQTCSTLLQDDLDKSSTLTQLNSSAEEDDCKHISECMKAHEGSKIHGRACVIYKQWCKHATIDDTIDMRLEDEKNFWRMVVERILNGTLTLATCNLAFPIQCEVLESLNILSKSLQSEIVDLLFAYNLLRDALRKVTEMRGRFGVLVSEASEKCERWGITKEFHQSRLCKGVKAVLDTYKVIQPEFLVNASEKEVHNKASEFVGKFPENVSPTFPS